MTARLAAKEDVAPVYLDVGELTWHEIETYTAAVWPLLRRLTADERERLRRGLLDGTLRNIEETRAGTAPRIQLRALRCG